METIFVFKVSYRTFAPDYERKNNRQITRTLLKLRF